MNGPFRLPHAARLRDEPSIQALRHAARVRGRWFVVASQPRPQREARLLVRIPKRVLKRAVARNRIRRCVKEVFRYQRGTLDSADFLVSLTQPYREPTLQPAREELERLFRAAARCALPC